jgi:hypothetical protein
MKQKSFCSLHINIRTKIFLYFFFLTMANNKKIWETLEGQENKNAFYVDGQESLLY